jgi:NADP-dependent 3-hydroxy acid dehydrogenase YdfG
MTDYSTQVAAITGAGSGIGRAIAMALARRGSQLALSDQDAAAVAETAGQCDHRGAQVRADAVDVTDRAAVLDWSEKVFKEFGRIDLVFCAAGVIHTGSLLSSDFADIDHVLSVNLLGVINTSKAFLAQLISSLDGRLVIFSSGFGLVAAPHYSAYNASKFAVRGFAEALRQEMLLDGHPVSVTCVYPGGVRTPIMRNGRFAADEDAAAIIKMFDTKVARMNPDRAAAIVLRGVEKRQAQILVGVDVKLASAAVRVVGGAYQGVFPWLGKRMKR